MHMPVLGQRFEPGEQAHVPVLGSQKLLQHSSFSRQCQPSCLHRPMSSLGPDTAGTDGPTTSSAHPIPNEASTVAAAVPPSFRRASRRDIPPASTLASRSNLFSIRLLLGLSLLNQLS